VLLTALYLLLSWCPRPLKTEFTYFPSLLPPIFLDQSAYQDQFARLQTAPWIFRRGNKKDSRIPAAVDLKQVSTCGQVPVAPLLKG
jgi:hypothetical protein